MKEKRQLSKTESEKVTGGSTNNSESNDLNEQAILTGENNNHGYRILASGAKVYDGSPLAKDIKTGGAVYNEGNENESN